MRKVPGVQTRTISKLLLGSPGTKSHSDGGATERCREPRRGGEEATAPSNIIKVQIVHGGKEMPLDGVIVLPENVQVEPFLPKS
jgi:hypothetical protein